MDGRAQSPAAVAERAAGGRILVADDQPDVLRAIQLLLKLHGFAAKSVSSPAAVLAEIGHAGARPYDLLLMDLNYARDTTSGGEGLELIARVREMDPDLPIVVMTAWSTVPLAVTLMREGAGDFVEKPWDNARLLAAIKTQVAAGRQRRRAHRLEADAREIQHRLLSAALPSLEGFEIGVAWSFAEHLGGDAHGVSALPDGRLGVAIADVCGKGTPAALLMASAQATLADLVNAGLPPAEVCARLGQALAPRVGDDRFVSLAYLVLDRDAGRLTYCNAGHLPPLLVRRGDVARLDRGGPVLGVLGDASYEEATAPLEAGDRLVLFTDGIVEAGGGSVGEELGDDRLVARLRDLRSASAQETAEDILALARGFARGRLEDDATVVVVDVRR